MSTNIQKPTWVSTEDYLVVIFKGHPPISIERKSDLAFNALDLIAREEYQKAFDILTPEKALASLTGGEMAMGRDGTIVVQFKNKPKPTSVQGTTGPQGTAPCHNYAEAPTEALSGGPLDPEEDDEFEDYDYDDEDDDHNVEEPIASKPPKLIPACLEATQIRKMKVDPVLLDYIPEYIENGWRLEPLVAFAKNLCKVKSDFVRDQLVRFLRRASLEISEDGCFIAFRSVLSRDGKLWDCKTGTMDNSVGKTVKMAREEVDPDPHAYCSQGLHVAGWDYLKSFPGGTIIAVKVNPADVISVPYDYEGLKLRCCRFKVLAKDLKKPEDYRVNHELRPPRKEEKTTASKKTATKMPVKAKDLASLSGSKILELVKKVTGVDLGISPKSKKRILVKAAEVLFHKK